MFKKLAVYCPTYKRPHEIQRVMDNLKETTTNPYTLYFGIEREDFESGTIGAFAGANVIVNMGKPGYSDTLQTMFDETTEPFFFPANDDFHFLPGWDEASINMLEADPKLMAAGVSDGNSSGNHSTINMVKREYIETMSGVIDMPGRVLYPYHHNFSDTEFYETALKRGVWAKCPGPCIEHHHPGFAGQYGKEPWTDETYDKNNATANLDMQTYYNRRHLFA